MSKNTSNKPARMLPGKGGSKVVLRGQGDPAPVTPAANKPVKPVKPVKAKSKAVVNKPEVQAPTYSVTFGNYEGHDTITISRPGKAPVTFGRNKLAKIMSVFHKLAFFANTGNAPEGGELGEFKGHPVITLRTATNSKVTMGRSKAQAVVLANQEIEIWLATTSD